MDEGYTHISPVNGKAYRLFSRLITLNGGRQHRIYYFTRVGKLPKSGQPCDVPQGCEVVCNTRTGLPCVRRKLEA